MVATLMFGGCERLGSKPPREAVEVPVPPAAVKLAALQPFTGGLKIEGVATVLSPEPLIQLDSDIKSAAIALEFSTGQMERFKQTKSLSQQTVATTEKQARMDEAQLHLLENRLAPAWGQDAPFIKPEQRAILVPELASGAKALVRLDFPDTTLATPKNVRVAPLQSGSERPLLKMWEAPSGSQAMPGSSYFGLFESAPGLKPGDRARLLAERAQSPSGVVVPSAAIVIYAGEAWCYVETAPEKFERHTVSLEHPVDEGYVVQSGFTPSTRVVVHGASVLLAREAGPGEADDDDGAAPRQDAPKSAPAGDKTKDGGDKPKDGGDKPAVPQAQSAPGKDDDDDKPKAAKKGNAQETGSIPSAQLKRSSGEADGGVNKRAPPPRDLD